MPREGENLLPHFVRELANQHGFSFGTPWLSDGSSVLVLPVLRTTARTRRYVLAAEVAADVRAVDMGRIDRLKVRNDSGRRVFLPPGSLFHGFGTQSRGTTAGVLLDPTGEAEVDVRCVQASHPIAFGATLLLTQLVPPDVVYRALLSRDQGLLWARVLEVVGSTTMSDLKGGGGSERPSSADDLVSALERSRSIPAAAEPTLSGDAGQPTQCGVVLLDARGVIATEIFDSPDSWRIALHPILTRQTRPPAPIPTSPWKATADTAAAIEMAKELLSRLGQAGCRRISRDSWTASEPLAAYTVLEGEVVHLVAVRRDEAERPMASPPVGAREGPLASTMVLGSEVSVGPIRPDEGAVAVADTVSVEMEDDEAPALSVAPAIRRKVLTSGWDAATFRSLEHFSRKEFAGDRSAAMRFLVRRGLQRRGYMGPRPVREASAFTAVLEPSPVPPSTEAQRTVLETRIQDFERIAETPLYAGWLRKRARLELERLATTVEDDLLRSAAQAALERLTPAAPPPEIPEPAEIEAPPPPLPVDVRPLLRQAFAASAGGSYPEALALFNQVLAAQPENRTALLGRAVALRRAGKGQEALADLDLVLRAEPGNAAALLNRGRLLQERNDFKGALDAFDRLVAVAPNDWDVWMARGDVLARMGQPEAALRSYGEALRRNPDDANLQARIHALEAVRATAAPRSLPRPAMPRGVEEGQSYLVKETHREVSFPVFRALAGQKIPSLLITARPRAQARQELGIAGVQILGLSYAMGEDVHNPTALASLTRTIERFVGDHQGRGAVLLDGLDELVSNNGFHDTILFVERVNEAVLQSKAIFLVSLTPGVLPDKESALLERDLKTLS